MENPFKKGAKDISENETGKKEEKVAPEEITAEENSETEISSDSNTESVQEETQEVNPLQEKYDTLNNQYLRLAADFDNFRKRNEQEREALLKYGAENTLKKMQKGKYDLEDFLTQMKQIFKINLRIHHK